MKWLTDFLNSLVEPESEMLRSEAAFTDVERRQNDLIKLGAQQVALAVVLGKGDGLVQKASFVAAPFVVNASAMHAANDEAQLKAQRDQQRRQDPNIIDVNGRKK